MPKDAPAKEYAVHHFRKTFELDQIPDALIVHTSGDNRYQLFVNEQMVTWGPLRGDLRHWYYESTDIAPYLKRGKNVIAAVVLNYGSHPPDAQLTVQTGFLLAANDKKFNDLSTNTSWKAIHNPAYSPSMVDKSQVNGYYGAGSKEIVDGNKYIWGWQNIGFDDESWQNAMVIENAYAKTCKWASRWKLTPRKIKHEILTGERFDAIPIQENIAIPNNFADKPKPFIIPPATKGRFVVDRGHLTTAYPVLKLSGGKNAEIKLTYVEAPYIGDPKLKQKGNRDEVEGKNFVGVFDKFIGDGGMDRIYQPLWWRAYRYIEIQIVTKDDPLTINELYGIRSVYPFEQKARFSISNTTNDFDTTTINKILEVGHRTMMACAHEHFMDCPYYEESQFEGDTRVEALVSYYNYGDPSLGKNAIEQFSWSINDEGFLSARYPTNSLYYIPNFSIYWIGMLHDYMLFYDDPEFIKSKITVMRMILDYFARHERANGTVSKLDYHQFVDWSFKAGEPPFDENGYSAIADLHYLMALQWASAIEHEFGESYFSKLYADKAASLSKTIRELYWDESLGLFTDTPHNQGHLSQHTNCLAILTEVTSKEEAKQVMNKVLTGQDMTKATLYWQFYLFEALEKANLGNAYLDHLGVWEEVLELGVTTWPETGPQSRSECHGWGSSPNYHLLKIVAGITSESQGFKKIRIQPNFGDADNLDVEMPHYLGKIKIKIERSETGIFGVIELPNGTEGIFIWNDEETKLISGKQKIEL
jgi:alpha-L-rhamnosidase